MCVPAHATQAWTDTASTPTRAPAAPRSATAKPLTLVRLLGAAPRSATAKPLTLVRLLGDEGDVVDADLDAAAGLRAAVGGRHAGLELPLEADDLAGDRVGVRRAGHVGELDRERLRAGAQRHRRRREAVAAARVRIAATGRILRGRPLLERLHLRLEVAPRDVAARYPRLERQRVGR